MQTGELLDLENYKPYTIWTSSLIGSSSLRHSLKTSKNSSWGQRMFHQVSADYPRMTRLVLFSIIVRARSPTYLLVKHLSLLLQPYVQDTLATSKTRWYPSPCGKWASVWCGTGIFKEYFEEWVTEIDKYTTAIWFLYVDDTFRDLESRYGQPHRLSVAPQQSATQHPIFLEHWEGPTAGILESTS